LARFNVEVAKKDAHDVFTGLPSPAAAGTIASFAIALPGLEHWTEPSKSVLIQQLGTFLIEGIMVALPPLTLLLSALMVSRVCYRHVVNRFFVRGYRFDQLSSWVLIICAACIVHEVALPLAFCLFALGPPVGLMRQKLWAVYGTRVGEQEDYSRTNCSNGERRSEAPHDDFPT
jgi:CDP-diacylglycerol--serine O-phosphatidyltransferase